MQIGSTVTLNHPKRNPYPNPNFNPNSDANLVPRPPNAHPNRDLKPNPKMQGGLSTFLSGVGAALWPPADSVHGGHFAIGLRTNSGMHGVGVDGSALLPGVRRPARGRAYVQTPVRCKRLRIMLSASTLNCVASTDGPGSTINQSLIAGSVLCRENLTLCPDAATVAVAAADGLPTLVVCV